MLGELAAALVSPSVSPVTAVGGAVIDAVPPGVKDWAVSLFGTADKLALLVGMSLVIAAVAALAGALEWRRRFAGLAVVAVFAASEDWGSTDAGRLGERIERAGRSFAALVTGQPRAERIDPFADVTPFAALLAGARS